MHDSSIPSGDSSTITLGRGNLEFTVVLPAMQTISWPILNRCSEIDHPVRPVEVLEMNLIESIGDLFEPSVTAILFLPGAGSGF